MRVLLAGGGSGGSATPILAVASELRQRQPDIELLYIGTQDGPEGVLAQEEGIPYVGVAAGKLRRYWDTQNVTDLGKIVQGVGQSLGHVRKFRPHVACGAGGFASVPPLVAAAVCRVPVLVHQQDVIPGLANKLLVPFATRFTVALPDTVAAFPTARAALRGNPVRQRVLDGDAARAFEAFGLDPSVPLVLVTGGGTGALGLNKLIAQAAPELVTFCQVLHLTGRGRGVPTADLSPRYQQHELLVSEMPDVLAAATLVVTRAGMGTLTELSALSKPAVVIPMPGTHQEANARAFGQVGAALALDQGELSPASLTATVHSLLDDEDQRQRLGAAIHLLMPGDAASRIAEDVLALGARKL